MAFRMNCLLCSRSALVLTRVDRHVSYQVDCPKCGRYQLSNLFAKHYALHPEAYASLPEKQKAVFQDLIRSFTDKGQVFTFQWRDIQRPLQ